jgi:hypothetical protein
MSLLEGIARSALAYDRVEYADLTQTLKGLASQLESATEPDTMLALAQAANTALDDYNRGAQRVHAAQTVELRCMIEMLSQTLVGFAEAGGQSVQTLQNIRNQVESASRLDDIRLLRARLGESLKAISDEARRQRGRNHLLMRQAQDALAAAAGTRDTSDTNKVSVPPSTEKAEKEITARIGADSPFYAVVFVVERLGSINSRYGYSTGDQLLELFGSLIQTKLVRLGRSSVSMARTLVYRIA